MIAEAPPSPRGQERLLHRLADSFIPRFAETFERSVEQISRGVTTEIVAADMAYGLTEEPSHLFALIDQIQLAKQDEEVESVFTQLLLGSANLQGLREALTIQSPLVQQAARTLTANLVTGVKDETKKSIRQIIFESIRDGEAPALAQRTIRRVIGLNVRDALALKRVSQTQLAAATTSRLREIADRRIERYSRKLLRDRAEMIARTETIRAGNVGRQLAWKQEERDGLIDTRRFRQRWLVTHDERLCARCAPMDGKLVVLGGKFNETERGVLPSERVAVNGQSVETPPLHPRCRCTLVADFG